MKPVPVLLALGLVAAAVADARAGEVNAAVAANFAEAAREIAALFEAETGHATRLSFGSTGTLYAQIAQGAPFDAFLAADRARPERAEAEGLTVADTRFTYAIGRLVLFSRDPALVTGPETLASDSYARLAIANPATAPYGAAAVATMEALGVDAAAGRIVLGNNAAQAYQFVATGNAELGFVALAQVAGHEDGSRWVVPNDLHDPIAQDAVLLKRGGDNPAAAAFLDFLRSDAAASVLTRYGYGPGG